MSKQEEIKRGDKVLIKAGVFTGFIGVVRKQKTNGDFIITLKIDYNLQDEKIPITIWTHRNWVKKIIFFDAKDLRLEGVDENE